MSDFQKRHYEAIARAIRDAKANAKGELPLLQGIALVQRSISYLFNWDNGLFDLERFTAACEFDSNPRPAEGEPK